MTAGLPGTGIGGIFYFVLAFFMPARELITTLQGRSSWQRWGCIGVQWCLVGGIMAATWGEAWLLTAGLTWLKDNYGFDWVIRAMSWNQTKFMATAAVCGSLVTLTFVAFLVHFIRFLVQWDRTRSPQPVGSLLKATGPDAA